MKFLFLVFLIVFSIVEGASAEETDIFSARSPSANNHVLPNPLTLGEGENKGPQSQAMSSERTCSDYLCEGCMYTFCCPFVVPCLIAKELGLCGSSQVTPDTGVTAEESEENCCVSCLYCCCG